MRLYTPSASGAPEGGPVPEHDELGNVTGFRQDEEGRALVSRPDEIALQQIAESGGGAYFQGLRAWRYG